MERFSQPDQTYIVGPDSEQTMVKGKNFRKSRLSAGAHSDDDHDRYLLHNTSKDLDQIQEAADDDKLAKTRKNKRAAKSHNRPTNMGNAQRV